MEHFDALIRGFFRHDYTIEVYPISHFTRPDVQGHMTSLRRVKIVQCVWPEEGT